MQMAEIQMESVAGRTRLRLPARDLGRLREFGWLAIGGGVFVGLFMLYWISGPLLNGIDLLRQGQGFGWVMVAFASTGLFGLSAAVAMLVFGTAVLRQKTYGQIEIHRQHLFAWERFGLLWKRVTKAPLDEIQVLEIAPVPHELVGQLSPFNDHSTPEAWCVLRATGTQRPLPGTWLASAYPRELLERTAVLIQQEAARTSTRAIRGTWMETPIHFTSSTGDTVRPESHDAVEDGGDGNEWANRTREGTPRVATDAAALKPRPERPESCRVEVIRQPGQPTVFRMPALGFRGQAAGMLVFAGVWNGFLGLMAFFILASAVANADFWGPLPMLLFMIPFLGVGLFLLVYGLNIARRTALIGVDPDFLFCETQELRKKSWVEIPLADVHSIEVGPSGTTLNDQPLMQLQIKRTTPSANPARLFTGVPAEELEWIAAELWEEIRQVRGLASTATN